MSVHINKLDELIILIGSHPKVKSLGLTKLWKIIYFIDAEALRELGATVTGSEYIRYEYGPVPSRGDKRLKSLSRSQDLEVQQRTSAQMRVNEVSSLRKADLAVFEPEELKIIDRVCDKLGRMSAKALSDLSHLEPAWHYANPMQKLSPDLMHYGSKEDPKGL